MPMHGDDVRMEYEALMNRGRDAERTAQVCWIASGIGAAVLMSWAISARNPGLLIPVEFALAIGFYAMLRSRQQVRWIAGYIRAFYEGPGGPQWFSRMSRLQNLAGFRPAGDWLLVSIANIGMLLTVAFAWMYSGSVAHGDLMAAVVTLCGVGFAFHSVSETVRMGRLDGTAMWRSIGGEQREATRPAIGIVSNG